MDELSSDSNCNTLLEYNIPGSDDYANIGSITDNKMEIEIGVLSESDEESDEYLVEPDPDDIFEEGVTHGFLIFRLMFHSYYTVYLLEFSSMDISPVISVVWDSLDASHREVFKDLADSINSALQKGEYLGTLKNLLDTRQRL
ncbi:hypothetical protein AX774_g2554 [Zancudomyces culisetae]|uniref:Uncharacterized protein n=1 Tax=Zancudomyces culisetae TaxID=1213189 RepID=A0A1R1PSR0_ZANCU|nr:hypothetical protein AX774_g2554 [Zancudomyces culisetae]|eukprot:OMH83933.1 hypothetical protein AX774_g2554 [Zancudomyces culisetae]